MKLLIAVLACGFAAAFAQQENQCPELATCMTDAQDKFDECQSILENREERPRGNRRNRGNEVTQQCREDLREIFNSKKEKLEEKNQMFKDCLLERIENIEDLPPVNEAKCERKGAKAQAKIDRRESRRAGRIGNRRRNSRMNEFQQCMQEARDLKNACKPLVGCCSEAAICHLEYETSELHDEIKSLQLDAILTRRECKKSQGLNDEFNDQDIVTESQILTADMA